MRTYTPKYNVSGIRYEVGNRIYETITMGVNYAEALRFKSLYENDKYYAKVQIDKAK